MTAIEQTIGKTISELQNDIDKRRAALEALEALFPDVTPPAPEEKKVNRTFNPRAVRPRAKSGHSRRPRLDLMEACANLPQPFVVEDFAKAAGLKSKAASSNVYRWSAKGLLAKAGPGLWKWVGPTAQAATAAPPMAEPEGASAKLVDEIEKACKERDRARENGRDKLADILQRKVDKLQAELDAAS
jgi:hypothetical protein